LKLYKESLGETGGMGEIGEIYKMDVMEYYI